ncbi:MAG: hypothetical protein AAF569_08990, partial [Pseudomonadota bacterium]
MSIESEKLQEANENLNQKIGIGFTALFALIGVYVYFIYGFAYLDITSLPYMGTYIALCAFLYFSLKSFDVLKILGITLLAGIILIFSVAKTNWQKQYYETDEPFMFQAHIEDYPSWEANLVSPITGQKNWVAFANECGKPAQEGRSYRKECSSYSSILGRYNPDMNFELDEYLARMRHTAIL